jgi:hypothetical protein
MKSIIRSGQVVLLSALFIAGTATLLTTSSGCKYESKGSTEVEITDDDSEKVATDDGPPPVPPPRPGLKLEIEPLKESTASKLVVRVQVTNTRQVLMGWDREFSVFLLWELIHEESDWLEPIKVQNILPPLDRSRFVQILPGKSLSKDLELTALSRHYNFVYPHFPHAWESLARYELPRPPATIKIQLLYKADDITFQNRFGYKPQEVGLELGWCASNKKIVRTFRQRANQP